MENVFVFKNWIEVAIGVQNDWLDYQNLTQLWDQDVISIANKDSYADLYFAEQKSKEDLLSILSKFIEEDHHIKIPIERNKWNIDYAVKEFQEGLKIWEYHFLYPIYASNRLISEKLEEDIYNLWCDFVYFNVKWDDFLWIAASRLNKNENELYHSFEKYINKLSDYLESR